MSNEIAFTDRVIATVNGRQVESGWAGTQYMDMTGDDYVQISLQLTTTFELIPTGDIGTLGVCRIENTGTVNVEVGQSASGDALLLLLPGESCRCRLGTDMQTPAVRTTTSTGSVDVLILES